MPVEIRELNIKVSLDSGDVAANSNSNQNGSGSDDPDAQNALIEIIVEKVLDIIKTKTER